MATTRKLACRLTACAVLAWMSLATGLVYADGVPGVIQSNYDSAVNYYHANPNNDAAAWHLGHACFDRAEFSRDDNEKAALATQGANACRKLLLRRPNLAAAHYYLGLDLAQLARTKTLGALFLVPQMESEWKSALVLDQKIDYGGPDRYLGLLYRQAPVWPVSVGNRDKAREHLFAAFDLSPNFPENALNLIESQIIWNETEEAARTLAKLRGCLPAARQEFSGPYWLKSWEDWDQRLAVISARLGK